MGAITQAMARAGAEHGVTFRCSAPVDRILIEQGKAVGVRSGGRRGHTQPNCRREHRSQENLSETGGVHLPKECFADDIANLRFGHASLRMNLALSGAPEFTGLTAEENHLARASALYIYPSRSEIQAGYQAACEGKIHEAPYVNMLIPSSQDPTLAPPGHHVMSLLCKYYPYRPADGGDWKQIKERVANAIVRRVARYIPNLPDLIVGRQILSPADLEQIFGLTEGDISMVVTTSTRSSRFVLIPMRRSPTPVDKLYLCGSGSHPGGGVSGAPGRNAAMRIIADLGARRSVRWIRFSQ